MMKHEQFEAALRERTQRQPFQPFVIETDYDQRFEIPERKCIHHFQGMATLFHLDGKIDFLDPEDISRVYDLALPAAT